MKKKAKGKGHKDTSLSNDKLLPSLGFLANIRLNRFLQRLWSYFSWRVYIVILAGLFYLYFNETTTWFLIYTVPPLLGIWAATLALNNNISLWFDAFIHSLTESDQLRKKRNHKDHDNEFKCIKLNNASQKELNKLIDFICRDFVSSWYKNLSQNDRFEKETRHKLQQVCQGLIDRIGNMDPNLVVQHLIGILTNHFHTFNESCKASHHRSHHDFNDSDEKYWQSYKSKTQSYDTSIIANQDCELDYVRHMATLLLYVLMSSDDFNCDTVRYLLREITAKHILTPIINVMSQPRIVNRLISRLMERVLAIYARRQGATIKQGQRHPKSKTSSNTLQPLHANNISDSAEYLTDVSSDSTKSHNEKQANKAQHHAKGIRPRAHTHTSTTRVEAKHPSKSVKSSEDELNSIEVLTNRNKANNKPKTKATLGRKLLKRVPPLFRIVSDDGDNKGKITTDHNLAFENNGLNTKDESEEDEFAQNTTTTTPGQGNIPKKSIINKRLSKMRSSLKRDHSVQRHHPPDLVATNDVPSVHQQQQQINPAKQVRSRSCDDMDYAKREYESTFAKALHKIRSISSRESQPIVTSKETILNLDFAKLAPTIDDDSNSTISDHPSPNDSGIKISVTTPGGDELSKEDIVSEGTSTISNEYDDQLLIYQ